MAQGFIIRGTGSGGHVPIHLWKRYGLQPNYSWTWNRWNSVTTVTYTWNKYNSSIQYTWNRWSTQTEYTWERWTTKPETYYTAKTSSTQLTGDNYDTFNANTYNTPTFDETTGKWTASKKGSATPMWWANINSGTSNYFGWSNGSIYRGSDNPYVGNFFYKTRGTAQLLNQLTGQWRVYLDGTIYSSTSATRTVANVRDGSVSSTVATDYPNPGVSGNWWYQNRTSALIKGTSSSGTVTATDNASAYPNPGSDGTYWYESRTQTWIRGTTSYGTVTATNNANAYPANGRWNTDGYWYVAAGSSTSYSKGTTSYGTVTSTNSSAYPNGGRWDTDGYWYDNRVENVSYSQGSYIDDIMSTDPSKYPQNGMSGDYWYVYSGTI